MIRLCVRGNGLVEHNDVLDSVYSLLIRKSQNIRIIITYFVVLQSNQLFLKIMINCIYYIIILILVNLLSLIGFLCYTAKNKLFLYGFETKRCGRVFRFLLCDWRSVINRLTGKSYNVSMATAENVSSVFGPTSS